MLTSFKTRKRKLSRRNCRTQKDFIQFYNLAQEENTRKKILSKPKVEKLAYKLNDIKIYSEVDSFLGLATIILMASIAIFILGVYPSEGKTLKALASLKIKQSIKISQNYSGLNMVIKGENMFYNSKVPQSITANINHSTYQPFNYVITQGINKFTNEIK